MDETRKESGIYWGAPGDGTGVVLPMARPADKITTMLQRVRNGDTYAQEEFSQLVYKELKKIARGYMAGERPGHRCSPRRSYTKHTSSSSAKRRSSFKTAATSTRWRPCRCAGV